MKQEIMTVKDQQELAPGIFELRLTGALVAEMVLPGQFVHIRVPKADLLLRRPISICQINHDSQECVLIYRVEGEGTQVLTELQSGDALDVMGPLGNGFPVDDVRPGENILVIGGGIGIPPLYELTRQLVARGAHVTNIHGFRQKEQVFCEEEFKALGLLAVATEDGSYGVKGYVSDCPVFSPSVVPDAIYACGPNGLLKKVDSSFQTHSRAYLSLEARMACGLGACYACVCDKVKKELGAIRVCKEGPVLKTGEVIL